MFKTRGGGGKRVMTIARFKNRYSRPASKSIASKIKPDKAEGSKLSKSSGANIASDKSEADAHVNTHVVTPPDFSCLTVRSKWGAKANEAKGLTSNKPYG